MKRRLRVGRAATLLGALVAVLAAGCAHERIAYQKGCWVKRSKSRWGDTREQVQICEPRAPAPTSDPILSAIETCTYRAQMAWTNAALQQIRQGQPPPTLADAQDASSFCVSDAHRMALEKVAALGAEARSLERETARLASANDRLQDTIVRCVEKQPNAIAEATASTNADSTSGSTGRHEARWEGEAPGGTPAQVVRVVDGPGGGAARPAGGDEAGRPGRRGANRDRARRPQAPVAPGGAGAVRKASTDAPPAAPTNACQACPDPDAHDHGAGAARQPSGSRIE